MSEADETEKPERADIHPVTHLLISGVLFFPMAWLNAWTLLKLWGWFAVPLGAPVVGLWTMAGLALLGACLSGSLDVGVVLASKLAVLRAQLVWVVTRVGAKAVTGGSSLSAIKRILETEPPDQTRLERLVTSVVVRLLTSLLALGFGALYVWLGG